MVIPITYPLKIETNMHNKDAHLALRRTNANMEHKYKQTDKYTKPKQKEDYRV